MAYNNLRCILPTSRSGAVSETALSSSGYICNHLRSRLRDKSLDRMLYNDHITSLKNIVWIPYSINICICLFLNFTLAVLKIYFYYKFGLSVLFLLVLLIINFIFVFFSIKVDYNSSFILKIQVKQNVSNWLYYFIPILWKLTETSIKITIYKLLCCINVCFHWRLFDFDLKRNFKLKILCRLLFHCIKSENSCIVIFLYSSKIRRLTY